jgi:hypothetical protein
MRRNNLTATTGTGKRMEEKPPKKRAESEMTKAAKGIDSLRTSAESTPAGRASNCNLRLLVLDDDGFVPRHAALFWCSVLSFLLSRTQEQCGYDYDYQDQYSKSHEKRCG